MVALTQAGTAGTVVAELFGVSREHLSRMRGRVAEDGSAALLARRGRPPKLSEAQVQRCYAMADEGRSGADIATLIGVSGATISRLLSRRPRPRPERLGLEDLSSDVAPPPDEAPAEEPAAAAGEAPLSEDADANTTAPPPPGQLERIGGPQPLREGDAVAPLPGHPRR